MSDDDNLDFDVPQRTKIVVEISVFPAVPPTAAVDDMLRDLVDNTGRAIKDRLAALGYASTVELNASAMDVIEESKTIVLNPSEGEDG